jgi:hypothetical protein
MLKGEKIIYITNFVVDKKFPLFVPVKSSETFEL